MKKILVLFLTLVMTSSVVTVAADKAQKAQEKAQKEAIKAQEKQQKQLTKELKNKKDVLKDAEYKQLKEQFFNADGYGDTYNCKVEKQRFCKVKVLDSGTYVLCDRDVSRTQWESAKIFYKYGRCTKLN